MSYHFWLMFSFYHIKMVMSRWLVLNKKLELIVFVVKAYLTRPKRILSLENIQNLVRYIKKDNAVSESQVNWIRLVCEHLFKLIPNL